MWKNCTKSFFGDSSDEVVINVVLLVSAVILFLFLILKDGVKGLKIRAHWIPGDFLVLTALTIELLTLISTQGKPLEFTTRDIALNQFWMIHTSRIMLCVVIAYLVPAMANPGAEDFWGKILALAIVVILHVLFELYIVNPLSPKSLIKSLWPKRRGISIPLYYTLAPLMIFSFVLLLLLLGCANIAGRGIERILAKKIPLVLKAEAEKDDHHHHYHHSHEGVWREGEDHPHPYHLRCQNCWRRVEDAVLRAWIVARAYSLEYIIARSPLASSAAAIVTFQIAITIVAGVWKSPKLVLRDGEDRLILAITIMQCVFIFIGWSMIIWRWVTAVAYYGSWSSCFRIEDFWTRHLRDLQQEKKSRLPLTELLHAKIEVLVANESTNITLPRRLLYVVIWLQLFTVSISKACLLGSQILFRNKLTGKLLLLVLSKLKKEYCKYEGRLKGVQILGETSESLWLSNRSSIPKAVALISRGKEEGEWNCRHLVHFLATKRTDRGLGLSCLEPDKPQMGLKYLCKRSPIEGTQEEQFTEMMRTKSWKMTAVSLLSIIFQLKPIYAEIEKEQPSTSDSRHPSLFRDCMKAYSQAWEIMDFVEMADKAADEFTSEAAVEITSEAADQYFYTLEVKVKAADKYFETLHAKVDGAALAALKKESKSKTPTLGYIDSTDLKEAATPPESATAALAALKKECKRKIEVLGCVNSAVPKIKGKTKSCPNRWNASDSKDWHAAAWTLPCTSYVTASSAMKKPM
ncbi:hypothetical protein SUGI_0851150 [Cryptomeria japonica]|nr:hypothetical protein SUGI_0851150 [Cryptomeria japonica]